MSDLPRAGQDALGELGVGQEPQRPDMDIWTDSVVRRASPSSWSSSRPSHLAGVPVRIRAAVLSGSSACTQP